jgi:hypothetical protein
VWLDDAGASPTVFLYDIASATQMPISTTAGTKLQPRVSGNFVVWANNAGGGNGYDVYLYDIAAGREELLVGGPGDQVLASIDGSRIVYTSNANGFQEVFMYTLPQTPPPAPLPLGCDPAKTDPVGSSVTMTRTSNAPVFTFGHFDSKPKTDYFVCVDNGLSNGTQETAHFVFAADGTVDLTPADFQPTSSPPRHVAAKLKLFSCGGGDGDDDGDDHADDDDGDGDNDDHDHEHCSRHHHRHHHHKKHCRHEWAASLFGAEVPATVTVTIRVAK